MGTALLNLLFFIILALLTIGIVVDDFNNNGRLNIGTTNANSDTVSILIGNGDGTFSSCYSYNVGNDLNQDGKQDIIRGPNKVAISLGNGDGSFQLPIFYDVGSSPYGIAIADFDNILPTIATTFAPAVNYSIGLRL
ncbi:MAG: VCBS repeat-containing protein [Candidatus Midichloria sp.]|nr:VCBS repeat-containing protein [Candidatus Midichloria sp.]